MNAKERIDMLESMFKTHFPLEDSSNLGIFDEYSISRIVNHLKNIKKYSKKLKVEQLNLDIAPAIYNLNGAAQGIESIEIEDFKFLQIQTLSDSFYIDGDIRAGNIFSYGDIDCMRKFFKKYIGILEEYETISEKPKLGIYSAVSESNSFGPDIFKYEKLDINQKFSPICSRKEDINNDIEFFFGNIGFFKKFGKNACRKVLLVGEPGTGKTSICNEIALNKKDEYNIVFVDHFHEMKKHIDNMAKSDLKTIIVFEDCESSLRNNSKILNFLDGFSQPSVENGCYIIMTTNYPEKLEDRIAKRPGRIDRIFDVKSLNGNDAVECFKLYFTDIFSNYNTEMPSDNNKILYIVNNMTGAQIKELSNSTMQMCVQNNVTEFDIDSIMELQKQYFESLKILSDKSTSITMHYDDECKTSC